MISQNVQKIYSFCHNAHVWQIEKQTDIIPRNIAAYGHYFNSFTANKNKIIYANPSVLKMMKRQNSKLTQHSDDT